ncbi:MAG: AIPR family protein [Acidobacteriaceae bacterium]
MATAEQLKPEYSFIAAFQSDLELAKAGPNALPLFAVGLQLGIEDMSSFATEALTDHPQDKKADIIFIDEAEGLACIAQGWVAKEWGRMEAKANKANDLNTAVAWLFGKPIDDVPKQIRQQAKLLREGLQSKTIRKILIAYAHNAMESQNVADALSAVRTLLKGLAISKDAEIEVVELGLRGIEALYLASKGIIRVVDKVELSSKETITNQPSSNWNAHTFSLNGAQLYALYAKHGDALFSANLRDFLGARNTSGNVNNRIKDTVEKSPEKFFVLNNGITIITKKAVLSKDRKRLALHGISIVNGAQTTGAVHAAGKAHAANIFVLTRVITVQDEKLISEIVAGNNTQNSIMAWDRRSNDPVQIRIANEFAAKGLDYVHRRSSARKPKTSIFADPIGQALCAFGGDLQTAIRAKADIFENEATYNRVFPVAISTGHIFAVQTLSWAYDEVKANLKDRSNKGGMTDIEDRQLKLLDYPASKQFLLTIVGSLREEIAGRKIVSPLSFELKPMFITATPKPVINAWKAALQAILPQMINNLPAIEYQVVRSTEHMNTVSKIAKGIIAGVPLLQTSFDPLRLMLKT